SNSRKDKKHSRALVRAANKRSDVAVNLLADVRDLILAARQTVARGVNAALVRVYWEIGKRIRNDVLQQTRAKYGGEILPTLSAKLLPEFGDGFSIRNLARMISFAEAFPEKKVVTEFPPKKVLKQKLHQAVVLARARLEATKSQK